MSDDIGITWIDSKYLQRNTNRKVSTKIYLTKIYNVVAKGVNRYACTE